MSETRLKGALLPLLPARDEHPKSAGPLGDGEVPSRDQAAAGPGYREKAALGGFGITEATAGVAGHRAAVDGAGGVGVREVKPDESRREVTSSRSAVAAAVNAAEVVPSLSADAAGQAEASALRARGVGDGAAHEPRRVMPSRGGHGATATEAPGRGAGGAGDDAVSAAKAEAAAYTGGGGVAAAIAAGEVGASTAAAVAVSTTGTSSASSSSSSAPGAAAVGAPAAAAAAAGEAAAAAAASSTSGGATGTSAPTAASATSVSPKAAPAAAATAAAAATTATAPATFEEAMATSAGAAVGPAGGATGGSGAAGAGAAGRAAGAAGGAGAAAGGAAGPAAGPAAGGAAGGAACATVAAGASGGAAVGAAGASAAAGAAAHVQASTHGGSERCGALERSVMDTSSPTRSPERSANQGDPASLDAEVKAAVKTNEGLDEQQQQQAATTTTRGEPAVGGGTGGEATPLHKQQQTAVAAKEKFPGQSIYHIKWIKWKGESTAIITQNENGPCPLLAIMNVLLLSWKIRFPAGMEIINAEQLMECLGDFILETMPKEFSEAQRLNYEQNISDAMTIMHKLQTGLDVNVRFTGVADFEYTPECIVFDLLGLPLYHGWLVDPQNSDVVKAVGKCSYNQLVEKIISSKQSQNSEEFSEGMVAELFLDSTATQLTYHGLCELNIHVKEAEICVFFRNNHFSTIYKHKGQLFLLVTDQGFLTEESVVWESLHSVDGDGNFCDSDFNLRPPSDPANLFPAGVNQEQIDQDYLVALSLQQEQGGSELPAAESDLDLAKRLQEEENLRAAQYFQEQERQQPQQPPQPPQQPQQRQQQQPPSPGENRSTPAAGSAERERRPRRQEDKSKCVIL